MKKGLILIGLMGISIPIMSSETLVGVLMSQDTDTAIIDGRTFEGDSITSLVIAPKFSNSDFGGYLSVGGTFGRSEEDRKKDEENNDFKNNISYRVANLGLTYSPISNITILGGVGYGQSEGKYYHNIRYDNHRRVKFDTSHTEKDRGVNYNAGLNLSYKDWGIIAMYDTYPKVFSVGISYNYKPVEVRPKQNKSSSSTSSNVNDIMTGGILSYIGLMGLGVYKAMTDNHSYSEQELAKMRKEQKRYDSTPNDAYIVVEDNREDFNYKGVKIKCLKVQKIFRIEYNPKSTKPYKRPTTVLGDGEVFPTSYLTLDEVAEATCKRGF